MSDGNSVMRGVGFFDTGHRTPRTRDWSRPPESETVKPKSETEKLADLYLAAHERRQAEDRAEEQRKAEERRQRQEAECRKQEAARKQLELDQRRAQKQHELEQRRAAFDFADEMTIQIFDHAGLGERERRTVMQHLLDTGKVHDLEYTQYLTMKIVAERK